MEIEIQVITKPLVSRVLWEFHQTLKDAGLEQYRLFPVFHPKLSLLIDPSKIEESLRQTVFDQSVDLLIVEAPPRGIPRLAFDVYSSEQKGRLEDKTAVFRSIGVPYIAVNVDSPPKIDEQWLKSAMAETPDLDRLRDVILDWQWNAMLELERIASSKNLFLLHEVALESVISISGQRSQSEAQSGRAQVTPKSIPWHHVRFLRQTSFDGIICTPPPNCRPIMAIEYDGSHHLGPKQREKDQKKNEACESANLPLLRIQSRDLPLYDGSTRKDVNSDQRRLIVKHILELLVSELAEHQLASDWYLEQIHHFMISTAESIQSEFPHIADDISDYGREILEIAKQRSVELEETKQGIEGELESWREAYENSTECYMRSEEQKWERTQRSNPHLWNAVEALEESFEAAIWLNDPDFSVIDVEIGGGDGSGPRYIEVQGSDLLKLGGMQLPRRKFVESDTNISVVADRFALADSIRQRAIFGVLKAQATAALAADKERILAAFQRGAKIWDIRAEARSLSKRLGKDFSVSSDMSSLENVIDNKIAKASQRKTPDHRSLMSRLEDKLTPEEFEKLGPRDYTPEEIVRRLRSCHDNLKRLIGFLDIDRDAKNRLQKYSTQSIDNALTDLSVQGESVGEK